MVEGCSKTSPTTSCPASATASPTGKSPGSPRWSSASDQAKSREPLEGVGGGEHIRVSPAIASRCRSESMSAGATVPPAPMSCSEPDCRE
jgi:hypothetical protein